MKKKWKYPVEDIIIWACTIVALIIFIWIASGCSLLGAGADSSTMRIDHTCEVSITQAAKTAGRDDTDVIESIEVMPDCTTSVSYRQLLGDSILKIEQAGSDEFITIEPVVELESESDPVEKQE